MSESTGQMHFLNIYITKSASVTCMNITFLGTGAPFPTKDRNVTSIAVQLGSDAVLFDCGEGTQRQLLHSNLSFMKIKRIYISHMHGDHIFGLPGLVQTMGLNNRTEPLDILVPQGFSQDIRTLLEIGVGGRPFEVAIKELTPDHAETLGEFTLRTTYIDHSTPTVALAIEEAPRRGKFDRKKAEALGIPPGPLYSKITGGESVTVSGRVISPGDILGPSRCGRKLVICADTAPCPQLTDLAKDANVLIYEATFDDALAQKAQEFKHSTNIQAANVAKQCNVGHLVLYHFSTRYCQEEVDKMVLDCKAVFPEVVAANDLDEFVLSLDGQLRRNGPSK